MNCFKTLYKETKENFIKNILFMEIGTIIISLLLDIIGVGHRKTSFLETFYFLNIMFFLGFFLSKRLVSIKVSKEEVIFTFYRFIFYRQEERYLLKDIELDEEKEVVRANVNWIMVFYHKDRAIYKENGSSSFTNEERKRIKIFFTKQG